MRKHRARCSHANRVVKEEAVELKKPLARTLVVEMVQQV